MGTTKGIQKQLNKLRRNGKNPEDRLISEAQKLLNNDLFADKKILSHLGQYTRSFDVVDEEDVDNDSIYAITEIKRLAIIYRLKFLDAKCFRGRLPYELISKIKVLNNSYGKDLKTFKILAPYQLFMGLENSDALAVFVETNHKNYFLLYSGNKPLDWKRKPKYFPLQSFETLASTIIIFTAIVSLVLPTHLITLDSHAEYWSGYRAAAFFHLLIFNSGVTVYFAFAFSQNFSSSIWNRLRNFG